MKKISIEIKWALFFIVMMLLWMWLEKLTGLHSIHIDKHMIYTNFVAIPAILIYVFALRNKRISFYNGKMTYVQGLKSGIIITIIVTLFTPVTQIITSEIITPEYFTNVIEYTVKDGKMTIEEAQDYFNLKNYVIQSTIGAFIMGAVTSSIVAIFTRSKK